MSFIRKRWITAHTRNHTHTQQGVTDSKDPVDICCSEYEYLPKTEKFE